MAYLEKITDKIYAHTQGKTIGNVGLIVLETGNYLVDTSMYPVVAREIRTEMTKIATGKVLGAILTHYHFDHSGGNQHFKTEGIHAHQLAYDLMRQNYNPDKVKQNFLQGENKHLFEGLNVTLPTKIWDSNPYHPDGSDHIAVYRVGGHTAGSSLVFFKDENVLFSGDNLFAGRFPWGGDPSASPYDWLHSTKLIAEKKPDIIIPGHGEVQHSLKEIDLLENYLTKVIEIGERLARDGVSSDKAREELDTISYNPTSNAAIKEKTLEHWYTVISNKIV